MSMLFLSVKSCFTKFGICGRRFWVLSKGDIEHLTDDSGVSDEESAAPKQVSVSSLCQAFYFESARGNS